MFLHSLVYFLTVRAQYPRVINKLHSTTICKSRDRIKSYYSLTQFNYLLTVLTLTAVNEVKYYTGSINSFLPYNTRNKSGPY
jgi:hypothetical protein